MAETEMPPLANNDIAEILRNMQALQKKVEVLEECVRQHNITVPALEEGGKPASQTGIWRKKDNDESEDSYYPIEGQQSTVRQTEKYSADSYSMMVLNGPSCDGEWPLRKKIFFGVSLYVAFIQIASLIVLSIGAYSRVDLGKGNSSKIVRASQILSLSFYVVFPDASLHDFARALRYYPRSKGAQPGDPVKLMKLACLLRGFQGLLAVVPAWLLIMTAQSVDGVLLSFAAINVISNFDEAAFAIARTGAMGPIYKHEVERIENTDVPLCFYRDIIHIRYWLGVGVLNIATFGAMVVAWAIDPDDDDF